MLFSQWIEFEAERIVTMGLRGPSEHQDGYMRANIESAIRKAVAHIKAGYSESDPVLPFYPKPAAGA